MKNECIGYSSVRGNLHIKDGLPNQDSYLVKRYKFGTVLIVSDGMGSHKHADVGSHSVCKAVSEAIQIWVNAKCDDIRLLIPIIHSLWNLDIYPYSRRECGATCLFAFLSIQGKLYMGQLGDGNIYYRVDEQFFVLKTKEEDFANLTTGVNDIKSYEDWTLVSIDTAGKKVAVSLMTDGVSENLVENRKQEFVELIWKKLSSRSNLSERNNIIYKILRQWNPVNAGDDRTIVCYEKR